ncbi:SET and MYND domain-containing protein 4 [Halichoeres trimaculatus]|uniref:SET and MYND domain-containing protein 4 n=1 Tax=Halichoeres trimaculatus TaxID=147232 RepID=UPI003D9DDBC8
MDLPCMQWQDHVAQKWTGLDPGMKEHFLALIEIDDVFKCTLSLTTKDDLDILQSISAGHSVRKDTEQAAKWREKGNSSFKSRDYTSAALHYSQGICCASQSSEQLSLCYANRSAALYHLQHYQETLEDIDRALKNNYPSHLLHKLEERRTLCLKYLSLDQKANEDQHYPASENHKNPDRQTKASAEPQVSRICSQAALSFCSEKGRHLVAKERIAAGEVLLHDRAYSCVLIPGMEEVQPTGRKQDTREGVLFGTEHRRCHRCLAVTLCPVPCDGCSYSRYCSTSCQRDAWEEHHCWECSLGADLMVMGVMSQLALRVTLKSGLQNIQMANEPMIDKSTKPEPSCINQHDASTSHYGNSYLSVFHLLHHLNHHSPSVRFLSAVTAATLYLKLSKIGTPPAPFSRPLEANRQPPNKMGDGENMTEELWMLGSAVLRHILQLRCNAQAVYTLQDTGTLKSTVQSSREIRIATAIFPTLSLLNHSCCPNTSLVFNTGISADPSEAELSTDLGRREAEYRGSSCGVTATIRATGVIATGQEILHCYGPHSCRMAVKARQHLLQEQYFFLCQCEACTLQQREEEEGSKEGRQQLTGYKRSLHQAGLLCGKCKGPLNKSTEDGKKGFVCSLSSCGHHISSSEVSRRLQEIRIDLEKAVDLMERDIPDEALKLLKRTHCLSELVLAETHPLHGELEDATARAYATMGDWSRAAFHLEQSATAISSQYGEDSIEVGRQLFKLTQLHFNGGARGPALSIIPKVRRLLCLHCGPQCYELQELQVMEDCLRG